ncbi:MAG: hypothetical protein Q9166_000614 [cf. Caloplaca sp. 2 TL-2023]
MRSPRLPSTAPYGSLSVNAGNTNDYTAAPSSRDPIHEDGVMPIAVVGMACRFPGGSSNPEKLWEMLVNKRSGWSKAPVERFTQESFEHPSSIVGGTSIGSEGGIALERVAGSKTAVYIGVFSDDYSNMMLSDPESLPAHHVTGTGKAIFANRISYFFDLKGPSLSLDTGCSASLVALHEACQSIRCGESEQAIVGGTNLILSPKTTMSLARLGRGSGYGRGEGVASIVIKPLRNAITDGDPIRAIIRNTVVNQDGRTSGLTMPSCQAQVTMMQDAYSQARLDPLHTRYIEAHGTGTKAGDPIEMEAIATALSASRQPSWPLFVGSVKANIGHLESGSGLAGLIKAILCVEKGMLPPSINFEIENVDLHLEQRRMKVVKELQLWPAGAVRRASLNSFGYGGTNAHVILEAYDQSNFATIAEQSWEAHDTITNGNSHSSNGNPSVEDGNLTNYTRLILISHRTKAGVQQVAKDLSRYVIQNSTPTKDRFLDNLAYSLNCRRTLFDWRATVVASSPQGLASVLNTQTLEPNRTLPNLLLCFIFTGQGAQWHAMGRELISRYRNFRSTLKFSELHFKSLGASWSVMDELLKPNETSRVYSAAIGQPLCTAIQCALLDLLASWNIRPTAVLGHSSGEIAAAYACGALTLESALTISYHRGYLASSILERHSKLRGAMLAASISEAEAATFIQRIPAQRGKAVVACVNSPGSVTMSGDRPAIMFLYSMLEARQIFVRKLAVNTAYHSSHMELIADSYLDTLQGLPMPKSNTSVTFISSVTGDIMSGEGLDAAYWVRNMVSQVKFLPALQLLSMTSNANEAFKFSKPTVQILVEIGPHGALAGFVKQTLGSIQGQVFQHIPTLSRGKDAISTMLNAASRLAVLGYPIKLQAVNGRHDDPQPKVLVDLPPYPWDHSTSYWHESRLSLDYRKRSSPRHPLLGAPTPDFNTLEPSWRNIVRVSEIPWIRGHVIQSNIVYPAAGYVAMAVEASAQRGRLNRPHDTISDFLLKNIAISKPLLVPDNAEGIETQFVLRPYNRTARKSSDSWNEFRVFSYTNTNGWSEHCRGLVSPRYNKGHSDVEGDRDTKNKILRYTQTLDAAKATYSNTIDLSRTYEALAALGIRFQGAFQCIQDAVVSGQQSLGHIRIPDTASMMPGSMEHPHIIHPSTLDACMQMTSTTLIHAGMLQVPKVPTYIREVIIASDVPKGAGESLLVHSDLQLQGKRSFRADITGSKESTSNFQLPPIVINGLVCTSIPGLDSSTYSSYSQGKCHRLQWEASSIMLRSESSKPADHATDAEDVGGIQQVTVIQPKCPSAASESIVSSLCSILGERLVRVSTEFNDMAEAGLNGKTCICLAEIGSSVLKTCSISEWSALRQMLSSASRTLWVTKGGTMEADFPDASLITGLARTARSDNNALQLVTFDMDTKQAAPEKTARLLVEVLRHCFDTGKGNDGMQEMEFAERSGQVFVPRVVVDRSLQNRIRSQDTEAQVEPRRFREPSRSLRLEVATPGLLDSLRFVEDTTATAPLAANELRMQPRAYGVNFRDVMIALGQLEDASLMSSEHSGVVTEVGPNLANHLQVGDRICAWGGQAYAGSVTVSGDSVHRIPDNMTFETAASIPIVYATVYYGLVHIARVQKGESILIHSAAGGVGQAALMLANHLGAKTFVTVGSAEKKDLVMATYGVPEDRIFSSRELSFADGIKRLTDGNGVDVVLNSIAGEAFHATFECLSPLGRFVEIGKRDILADTRLDMGSFNKSITFASVDLGLVFEHDPLLAKRMITRVFALLATGAIQPVHPLNVFSLSDIESAFRLIQAGKHTGKVILQADEETIVKALPPPTSSIPFVKDASYIVVGGLGGLGRAICHWMASRDCKNIILLSRSGMKSAHAASVKYELDSKGVKLAVYECDVSDRLQLDSVLSLCTKEMPQIKGVIHSAMVIRVSRRDKNLNGGAKPDNIINKMTFSDYHAALRPKVQGTLNLHAALSSTPLEFFLLLSSCVGIIGNNGQANYASACTFQDAFARHRTALGMPTRSLDLGMISGAGYVHENISVSKFLTAQGFQPVPVNELLAAIEYAITEPIRDVDDSQLILGLTGSTGPENQAINFADARFEYIRSTQRPPSGAVSAANSLQSQLTLAKSSQEVHLVLRNAVVAQVSRVLVIPVEDVNPACSVSKYGADSLSAVELRSWFARDLDAAVGVMEILSSGKSIDELTREISTRSGVVRGLQVGGGEGEGEGGERLE